VFFVPLTFELSEGLRSTVDDGLYAMAIRIDYEASIVVGAIVWSWSRASVVFAPVQERLLVELVHGVSIGGRESEVETMACACRRGIRLLDAELVVLSFKPIAHRLAFFSRPQIFEDSDISKCRQRAIIEPGGAFYVGNREGDVMKHVLVLEHARAGVIGENSEVRTRRPGWARINCK
jgi:hypothetical protein